MKKAPTYWANIYVGLRWRHSCFGTSRIENICQKYVDRAGLCVTVTPTKFIYTDGNEVGAIVGLINYARFPSTPRAILKHAKALAQALKKDLGQERVTIMTANESILLGAK